MQTPPKTDGGRRKDIAEQCAQITHDDENGVIFVLHNTGPKEFAVKYDFSGSTNLALEPSSSSTKLGDLQVQCTVPANSAINLCHLKVKDKNEGYELRSKMATMVNDSTGFKSTDSQGDETRKAITDNLFIMSRRVGDGYQFFLQSLDEKADYTITIDFSSSQNFALKPAEGFAVDAGAPLKISGIVLFKTDRVELGSLQLVDKSATGAKMMYQVKASKSTTRWEKLQVEAAEKAKKDAADEAARKKAEEDAARKKAEEEAARKKAEEDAARKKAEEDAARKKTEEDAAAKKKAEDEAARKAKEAEAEAARKAKEEADRKKAEEEARKKKEAEDEAARKKKEAEEAARKKQEAEDAARRAKEEADRKAAEDAAAKKKAEEEEEARKKAEELARMRAAESAARADAEKKAAERAARRKLQGRTQPDCVKNRMLATDLGMTADTMLNGIRRDFGPVNWALFDYSLEPLKLIEGGSQGLFELFDFLGDDLAAVAIVRMAFGAGNFRRMKYIAIQWMGDNTKPMQRAKVQQIHEKMVQLIGPAHVCIQLMGAGERNAQTVIKKVEKVFVVDGSSQAGSAVTEADYVNAIREEQAATAEFYNEASGFGMVKK